MKKNREIGLLPTSVCVQKTWTSHCQGLFTDTGWFIGFVEVYWSLFILTCWTLYFLSYELVMSSVFIIAQRSLNHIRSHIKSDFILLFMFNIVNVNCISFSDFLEWNIKSRAGNYEGLRPQSAWPILSHRPLTVLPCNPAHVNMYLDSLCYAESSLI